MPKKILAILFAALLMLAQSAFAVEVSAPSAILVEQTSGKVLFEKNPHERLAPASVTKIMTMLLIMEAIERGDITYDTIVVASERAKSMGGSTIFLDTGEEMSVHDLLKGIAVASGNDACVAMAEHLSGSVESFVDVMNNRAAELGMADTHFVTCNGLDADGHLTSAADIAVMSRELLKHEDIFRYTTIWLDSLRDGAFALANTNKLIRFYSGANGIKTGSTSIAKNCVSASAKRDGMQLIAVIMGAETSKQRFADASALLNYGFANYAVVGLSEAGESAREVKVKKGLKDSVLALAKENAAVLVEKAQKSSVKTEIVLPDSVEAPIAEGEKLGEIIIVSGENELSRSDLVAAEAVPRKGIWSTLGEMMENFMTMK
ncbi:MAG: D-alanyl-D-alanine carboxypeptidase family protein [Clostridia bacterium]|nr:D-alanyl-D-alanine carboxypeptidase family protein [Clostridia bacterium]